MIIPHIIQMDSYSCRVPTLSIEMHHNSPVTAKALAKDIMSSVFNLGRLLLDTDSQQQVLARLARDFDNAEFHWADTCSSRVFYGSVSTETSENKPTPPNVKGLEKRLQSSAKSFETIMASIELKESPEEITVDYSEPHRHFAFIRASLHWLLSLPVDQKRTLLVLYILAFLYLLPDLKSKVCTCTEGELARRFFNGFDNDFEIDFCGDFDRRLTKSSVLKRCAKVPLEIALKYIRRYEILITDPEVYST